MESKQCFELGCELEVEYACSCTSPQTLFCELHFGKHYKLPDRDHKVEPIFVEPCEGTKEAILRFLTKEKSKHSKLKRNIAASFTQRLFDSEHDIKVLIKNLDSYSAEISNCFTKISKTKKLSKSEQDPVLGLLILHPNEAIEKLKVMIPANPDWYNSAKVFCGFSEKIEKIIECFIKDKFETYLDERLFNIESTLEEHNKIIRSTNEEHKKAIDLANNELANVMDTVSKIIKENKKSEIELEDWKKAIENEARLLNSQINRTTEDFNCKLNEVKPQNQHSEHINVILQELRSKTSEILSKPNDLEAEQDFRSTCSIYESDATVYYPRLEHTYQDYSNAYHLKTSLYILSKNESNRTSLIVYDTESGREEIKVLETPESLDYRTCIAQLPNGKLFFFGNNPISSIALLIDGNYGVRKLPSGTPCYCSSAIYFNRNVYCFGGYNAGALTLSERFDLDGNRWIKLTLMPQADYYCHSIITNGNILISGYENRNLLRYSVGSNTFTTIPFQFASCKRKILINAERLYLIECDNGSIYESEVSNDTTWRKIGTSIISNYLYQVYYSYNRGGINIACCNSSYIAYYKFDLNTKSLIGLL